MTDESGRKMGEADRKKGQEEVIKKLLAQFGSKITQKDRVKLRKYIGKSPDPEMKKGGAVKRKTGGTAKRQVGGTTQGYDARLDERLGMTGRPRSATGQTYAQRRAESRGARTPAGSFGFTAKKGGAAKRKKGGTVKRSRGGTAKKK